jgi:hypothetical protein
MNSIITNSKFLIFWQFKYLFIIYIVSFSFIGCKKFAETPIPTDQVAENAVYSNDATAIAVLTSLYKGMNSTPTQGSFGTSIGIATGLASDEYSITSPFNNSTSLFLRYYLNDLSQTNPSGVSGSEHWAPFYNSIFKCNAAIQGLMSSDALTPAVRDQLIGEAKFLRAFFYFYLVNEFGDVPLVLTTDPKINTNLPRASKSDVYQQMISDLLDAEKRLSSNFLDISLLNSSMERVRPTQWAASALLARVYLYIGEYSKSEEKATSVLSNTTLFGLIPALNNVFMKNSKEAIWQIQPTDQNFNTREGQALIIPTTGPVSGGNGNPVYLSNQLLKSFETSDKRKIKGNWVDTVIYKVSTTPLKYDTLPYVSKYKIAASQGVTTASGMTEYFMVLRLAEQYLIRAEARAQLGKNTESQADLNMIRSRAGLSNTAAADKSSLITAIIHERQVELFGEWGHRWFDLKRTGNIDAVMSIVTPLKANGAQWRSYQQLFPIPIKDIQASTNLNQNPNY